jgi:cob(I)alamin adenosyltransferase
MDSHYKEVLIEVQDRLFTVGAILATPPEKAVKKNGELRLQKLGIIESDIEFLEKEIDTMEELLPPMTHFILPGGHTTVSYCHIARCVCRRAERLAVHLDHNEPVDENAIKYLNRLSDYLFVLARKLSYDLEAAEVKWIPRK